MSILAVARNDSAPPTDELELSMTLAMALNRLPPLSPLVPKVLAMRRDPDAGIADLAKVIGSDPMLCARLIGMANAARFAGTQPTVRVQDALMRLGFAAACDVAVSVAVARSLPSAAEFKTACRDLWLHSLGVALCAREFARRMDAECDPDAAYLAGFLHDIGYLAIISLWPDMARQLIAQGTDPRRWEQPDPARAQGWPTHGALGGELCKLWRLPDDIWQTVWTHDSVPEEGTDITPLEAAVALAHLAVDGVLPLKHQLVWRSSRPLDALLAIAELAPEMLDEVRMQIEKQAMRMGAVADSI